MPIARQTKDLRPDFRACFRPQSKEFPLTIACQADVLYPWDRLELIDSLVVAGFRLQSNPGRGPHLIDQVFRGIAGFNLTPIDNDDPATSHLDFRQNVSRKQNRVLTPEVANQFPDLANLVG